MGRYFNPPDSASIESAGGRRIARAEHPEMVSQLREGEALGMHINRFIFKQMPDVTDPREFDEFISQVDDGTVRLLGFYAVPADRFGG